MSIGMTPDQYYEAFVEGNYYDFAANPGSVRHAFNAAVAASHLADHYYNYYKQHDPSRISQYNNLGDYIKHISTSTNGYFKDIRSISNAYKHLYTGASPSLGKYSSISSTGAIEVMQFVGGNISEILEKFSTDDSPSVVYTTKSGDNKPFMEEVKGVSP